MVRWVLDGLWYAIIWHYALHRIFALWTGTEAVLSGVSFIRSRSALFNGGPFVTRLFRCHVKFLPRSYTWSLQEKILNVISRPLASFCLFSRFLRFFHTFQKAALKIFHAALPSIVFAENFKRDFLAFFFSAFFETKIFEWIGLSIVFRFYFWCDFSFPKRIRKKCVFLG